MLHWQPWFNSLTLPESTVGLNDRIVIHSFPCVTLAHPRRGTGRADAAKMGLPDQNDEKCHLWKTKIQRKLWGVQEGLCSGPWIIYFTVQLC